MGFLRTLGCRYFHTLPKTQNPSRFFQRTLSLSGHLIFSDVNLSWCMYFILPRTLSRSATFGREANAGQTGSEDGDEQRRKKPLDRIFKEAVGLAERVEHSDSEDDVERESDMKELCKKLKVIEKEVRVMKENLREKTKKDDGSLESRPKRASLVGLFKDSTEAKSKKMDEREDVGMNDLKVYKELSPEMIEFATRLYKEGYFKDANFLPRDNFDATCFENSYARHFIKFAAEKFGKDNQEIAKWLSGSHLKTVALFGCPSLARKNVFSAKRLRRFFKIQEDTVCRKCMLKESCKFVNQSVWKGDANCLNLDVVMRVITLYALESVHPQLVVPDEVKTSVSHLLGEVLNLSQTVP